MLTANPAKTSRFLLIGWSRLGRHAPRGSTTQPECALDLRLLVRREISQMFVRCLEGQLYTNTHSRVFLPSLLLQSHRAFALSALICLSP